MNKRLFLLPIMAMLLAGCGGAEDPSQPTSTPTSGDSSHPTGLTSDTSGGGSSSSETSTSSSESSSESSSSTSEEPLMLSLEVTNVPFNDYVADHWAIHCWNDTGFAHTYDGERVNTSLKAEVSKDAAQFIVVAYNGTELDEHWTNKVVESLATTIVAGTTVYEYAPIPMRTITVTGVPANSEVEHWGVHAWGEGKAGETYVGQYNEGTLTVTIKQDREKMKVVGYVDDDLGVDWANVKVQSDEIVLSTATEYAFDDGGDPVLGDDFYIVGTMTEWVIPETGADTYKFEENNVNVPENASKQYLLTVKLDKDVEFKVFNPTYENPYINGDILEVDNSKGVSLVDDGHEGKNIKAAYEANYTMYLKVLKEAQDGKWLSLYVDNDHEEPAPTMMDITLTDVPAITAEHYVIHAWGGEAAAQNYTATLSGTTLTASIPNDCEGFLFAAYNGEFDWNYLVFKSGDFIVESEKTSYAFPATVTLTVTGVPATTAEHWVIHAWSSNGGAGAASSVATLNGTTLTALVLAERVGFLVAAFNGSFDWDSLMLKSPNFNVQAGVTTYAYPNS